jgi:hypothetical protein
MKFIESNFPGNFAKMEDLKMTDDVVLTNGKIWTTDENSLLAILIHKRFCGDLNKCAQVWSTMFQNDCSEKDFRDMIIYYQNCLDQSQKDK